MLAVAVIAGILFVWSLLAHRLSRWSITAPIAMIGTGVAMTAGSDPPLHFDLDTTVFEHAVEVVLALLLFVDAVEVPGSVIRRERSLFVRLLAVALPLTLCAAFAVGYLFFPDQPLWLLALLATVVVPLDLAPTATVVRDRRIPSRLRDVLNIEGGLNDGILSPVFLLCITIGVESHATHSDYTDALLTAVVASAWALGTGFLVGSAGGWLLGKSWTHGWTRATAVRLGVFAVPIAAYTLSVALGGNGFVASFVAGVCFAPSMRHLPESAVYMADDLVTLMALALWFVFGQIINEAFTVDMPASVVLYALLAVTLVRLVAVLIALTGSRVPWGDKLFLGWMGPRGVTTIVFGTLAVIDLPTRQADFIAQVMVMTVLASIVLHGVSAEPLARLYARAGRASPVRSPAG